MSKNYENDFFKHFEDSPQDPLSELFTEKGQPDEFEEMGELILRYQDGDMNRQQFTRLEDWLLGDCRAMSYYVEFVCLCTGLTLFFSKKPEKSFLSRFFAILK